MSKQLKDKYTPFSEEQLTLSPQEKLSPTAQKKKQLLIGIPRENAKQENRVALRPEAVQVLVNNGHKVQVETKAGEGSKFDDKQFSEAGAEICYSHEEIFKNDIILKIAPPTLKELEYIPKGKTVISALNIANLGTEYLKVILKKRLIGIAYELIQDRTAAMPIMRAMSEIAGSTVMLIAAEYLSSVNDGKGIILGGVTGVPPSKIVIIGAGTVGEYASRTALGLGAALKVFDKSIYKLRRLKYAIGHQIYTSTLDTVMLQAAIEEADVVIGAMRAEGYRSPCVVTEEMVKKMKPNSIMIDVSIDQGGCFETSETTSHQKPTFIKHDVIHYCVPNIASRVARTSSTALSNIFSPYILDIGEKGGIEDMVFQSEFFNKGVYAYKGSLTNLDLARRFELPFKDMRLLMAAGLPTS